MPAPSNNNFTNAITLTGSSPSIGPVPIDDATTEGFEPIGTNLTNGIHQTIWYKWIASDDGDVTINLSASVTSDSGSGDSHGNLDTTLAVWTGTTLSGLTEVASNDDSSGGHYWSSVTFTAVNGTTYYIQIGTYDAGYIGTVQGTLIATIPPPPPVLPTNETCATAISLSGLQGHFVFDNRAHDNVWVSGDPLLYFTGRAGGTPIWWKWTNTTPDKVLFEVALQPTASSPISEFSYGIFAGSCGAFTDLANRAESSHDGSYSSFISTTDLGSVVNRVVAPGETVYIEIDAYSGGTVDPPVAASAPLGIANFRYYTRTVTLFDDIGSIAENNDFGTTLVSDVTVNSPYPVAGPPFPLASEAFGGRFYFIWTQDESGGYGRTEIWGGSCDADGSNFDSGLIFLRTAGTSGPTVNKVPLTYKLFYDGTNVFAGISTINYQARNPHVTTPDFTSFHPAGEEPAYDIYQYVSGAWNHLREIRNVDYFDAAFHMEQYRSYACMSAAEPDKIWLSFNYISHDQVWGERNATPPDGASANFIVMEKEEIYDELSLYSYQPSTDTLTLIAHYEGDHAREQTFNSINYFSVFFPPNIIYDFPQEFETSTHFASVAWIDNCEITNEAGHPIMVGGKPSWWNSSFKHYVSDTDVFFWRPDIDSVIGQHGYSDFVGGLGVLTGAVPNPVYAFNSYQSPFLLSPSSLNSSDIYIGRKFFDAESEQDRLFVSIRWIPATGTNDGYTVSEVSPDFTSGPFILESGIGASSRVFEDNSVNLGSVHNVYKDGLRNYFAISQDTYIEQYDRLTSCGHAWRPGRTASTLTGNGAFNNQNGGWISEALYVITQPASGSLSIIKFPITRDYHICEVGDIIDASIIGNLSIGRITFRAYERGDV